MRKISTLCILGLFMFGSCNAQNRSIIQKDITNSFMNKMKNRKLESNVLIKKNETVFDKNHDINLTFKKLIKDNRCPINAKCISSGEGIVEIEVMSIHSRPQRFKLSTNKDNKDIPNRIIFNGFEISLEELNPLPLIGKRKLNKEASISLKVRLHALKSQNYKRNKTFEKDIFEKEKTQKGKIKLLENHDPTTTEFRIHPAEIKGD